MKGRYIYKLSYDNKVKVYDTRKHIFISNPTKEQEWIALQNCEG